MPKRNGWNVLYYGKVDDTNINSISSLTDLYGILKKATNEIGGNGNGKKRII